MNGEPGIDDDGNGYVDDFWGWDFFTKTIWWIQMSVTSMVTSMTSMGPMLLNYRRETNNELGVAGINWNVNA